MMMTSINNVQFVSLNNKRYYFSDGIILLPFGYPFLSELWDYKSLCRKYIPLLKKKLEISYN